MKFNKLWIPIGLIVFVALAALWKLNDFYRQERLFTKSKTLEQQASVIQTSVSEFLNVRKSLVAGLENGIVETNINWLQFKPFFMVARGEIKESKINLTEAVVNSDSLGKAWSAPFLNQALSYFKFGDDLIATKLFKNKSGQKFIALTFQYPQLIGATGGKTALVLVSEAEILQKFFLASQGSEYTHSLITSDQIVAAHTAATYVATVTQELTRQRKKEIKKILELRGTDLTLVSYVSSVEEAQGIVVPTSVMGIVLGACMVLIGILAFAYAPLEAFWQQQKTKSRSEEYKKTLEDSKEQLGLPTSTQKSNSASASNSEDLSDLVESAIESTGVGKRQALTPSFAEEGVGEVKVKASAQANPTVVEKMSLGSFGSYDVAQLVEAALSRMMPQLKEARVEVIKKIQTSRQFELDPDRFVKAITNLLQNSIEAVKDRGRREIEILLHDSGSGITLSIHDSGTGFKPEDADRIWQPFFTTKNKKLHKGLGLSEAVSIARRYGFDLKVTNSPKGGVLAEIIMDSAPVSVAKDHVLAAVSSATELEIKNDQSIEAEIEKILNLEDETFAEMKPIHFKPTTTESIEFKINEDSSPELEIVPATPKVPPPMDLSLQEMNTSVTAVEFKIPDLNVQFEPDLNIEMKSKSIDENFIVVRRPSLNREPRS